MCTRAPSRRRAVIALSGHAWRIAYVQPELGLTVGPGRDNLKAGNFVDALVTGYDSRVRMVGATWWRRQLARWQPKFYVNLMPLCFRSVFSPISTRSILPSKMKW